MIPDVSLKKKYDSMHLISFIWGFIQKQRVLFAGILVLSFMWTFETVFWPFMLGKIVDVLTRYDMNRLAAWVDLKNLLILGAVAWIFWEGGFRVRDFVTLNEIELTRITFP